MVVESLDQHMTPESLALTLIALGILGAHGLTLRLLTVCKAELMEHFAKTTAKTDASTGHLEEVVRIGADVADALEGLITTLPTDGGGMAPVLAKPPSMQDTIIGLMVDRFLGPQHGGTTGQEWPIHQEQATTTDDFIGESTTPDAS